MGCDAFQHRGVIAARQSTRSCPTTKSHTNTHIHNKLHTRKGGSAPSSSSGGGTTALVIPERHCPGNDAGLLLALVGRQPTARHDGTVAVDQRWGVHGVINGSVLF